MNTQEQMPSEEPALIGRREAIARVSAMLGGLALVGSDALLRPRRIAYTSVTDVMFSPAEIALMDEIAETILPATSTPGAKAAKVGAFMALMVTDSYDERQQQVFKAGLKAIDDASMQAYQHVFMDLTADQRVAVLTPFDQAQKARADVQDAAWRKESLKWLQDERQTASPDAGNAQPTPAITADQDTGPHFFRMMKELTLLGYFTSEIGMTKAQRYIESPGRYDPCVPYAPGEKSWAGHA
jgi:hypothetical protein